MRRPCEDTSQSVSSSCYQHHHAPLSSDADWRSGQASIWTTGEATAKALRARPRWNFAIVWILGPFLSMVGRLATGRGRDETDLTGSSAWSARHLASHQHATIIRLLYLICCGVVLCPSRGRYSLLRTSRAGSECIPPNKTNGALGNSHSQARTCLHGPGGRTGGPR